MTDFIVKWEKNPLNSEWYRFFTKDLTEISGEGVYIVWEAGASSKALYVGKGIIADRLSRLRRDKKMLQYPMTAPILASWAVVPASLCAGVERYLIDTYNPIYNVQTPNARPIVVNLLG